MTSEEVGKFVCPHCGDWHPADTSKCPVKNETIPHSHKLVGSIMEGKYKIVRLLGEGGMGVVYEATHTLIGRRLAVKVLHPEVSQMPELVERFYNEARTAAAVGHEHIIEITDMGTHKGSPFIVMEFLEGQALTEYMRDRILGIPDAVAITLQVLDALNAVHANGVIHRDLKPDNIHVLMKGGRHFVKILDFGISKLKTPEVQDMHLTRTGTVLGTPYYMAPEQAAGKKEQDHRIDIYAAGVILYEMLTLSLPYQGDNYNALLAAILTEEAPLPSTYNPDIPVELENVIMTAIAKQPATRYPNAVKFMEALQPFAPAWAGRPSRIPGLTQTQGGYAGQPAGQPGYVATPMPSDLGNSQTLMAPTPTPGMMTPAPTTGTDWSMTADAEEAPKKSHVGLIIGVVLGLLVLVGGGVAAALVVPSLLKGRKESQPVKQLVEKKGGTGEKAGGGDEVGKKVEAGGDVGAPQTVSLNLDGLPEGATVTLEGEVIASLPAELPRSNEAKMLRVTAEGYDEWEIAVILDASKSLTVDLQPEDAGGTGKKKGGKKDAIVVKLPPGTKPTEGDLKKPDVSSSVKVTKKGTKKTDGIYSGKRKNIDLEYPE
jgi:serine/threonine-protein kinase